MGAHCLFKADDIILGQKCGSLVLGFTDTPTLWVEVRNKMVSFPPVFFKMLNSTVTLGEPGPASDF